MDFGVLERGALDRIGGPVPRFSTPVLKIVDEISFSGIGSPSSNNRMPVRMAIGCTNRCSASKLSQPEQRSKLVVSPAKAGWSVGHPCPFQCG